MMMQTPTLSWPHNLFDNAAMAQPLPQEGVKFADDACPCGCGNMHRNNIPQTLRLPDGTGWQVIYFYVDSCKSKWNRERTEGRAVT
jgi:hypothetical protein